MGPRRFSRRGDQWVPSRDVLEASVVLRRVDVRLIGEGDGSFRCGTVPESPQILDDSVPRASSFYCVLHRLCEFTDTFGKPHPSVGETTAESETSDVVGALARLIERGAGRGRGGVTEDRDSGYTGKTHRITVDYTPPLAHR